MIYCVWYPSGGFGTFITTILSTFGNNFIRPNHSDFKFSSDGNSHLLRSDIPVYRNTESYKFDFDHETNYAVLVDNGIDNQSDKFFHEFPGAMKIKICYTDFTWPVVANTFIVKAMQSTPELVLPVEVDKWDQSEEDWVKREKFFLFLKEHAFRYYWKPQENSFHLEISDIRNYDKLKNQIESMGIVLDDFRDFWNSWYELNSRYFTPVDQALAIIDSIKNNTNYDLSAITNLWDQAVIYYILWITYNKEIPHYDYADFFKDSNEIKKWLNQ